VPPRPRVSSLGRKSQRLEYLIPGMLTEHAFCFGDLPFRELYVCGAADVALRRYGGKSLHGTSGSSRDSTRRSSSTTCRGISVKPLTAHPRTPVQRSGRGIVASAVTFAPKLTSCRQQRTDAGRVHWSQPESNRRPPACKAHSQTDYERPESAGDPGNAPDGLTPDHVECRRLSEDEATRRARVSRIEA
jgi:hypothetical protein